MTREEMRELARQVVADWPPNTPEQEAVLWWALAPIREAADEPEVAEPVESVSDTTVDL